MFHTLKIKICDELSLDEQNFLKDYYQSKIKTIGYERDCGVDLVIPKCLKANVGCITKINFGIECEFIPFGEEVSGPFWLIPRSSISNTPLQMANGIGVIDPEYRGPIIAAVRCFEDSNHKSSVFGLSPEYLLELLKNHEGSVVEPLIKHYYIEKGVRLFQIISPDGKPIKIELVEKLTQTKRGSNGFGSTNK